MTKGTRLLVVAMWLALAGAGTADASDEEFVVIVSADNPVRSLPAHTLADIYLGRRTRFPDGRPAQPVDYRDGGPASEAFYREILERTAPQLRAHWSRLLFTGRGRPPHQVDSVGELLARIASDPNAIGYVSAGMVDDTVRVVRLHR